MSTPMRRQYLQIKKQYPETIVLFRLGDFYETFDDDAKVVARVCDIVLTSRPVGKDQRVPLAGVPYHSVESYLARLIQAGHKVAIVEQVGDVTGRGLVDREVVRVVTPGTVVEPSLLEERRNNYLAAMVLDGSRAGLAYADITTGEFATTQLAGDEVMRLAVEELERLQPAEIVSPDADLLQRSLGLEAKPGPGGRSGPAVRGPLLTHYERWPFEFETAGQTLKDHFAVASLDGFGVAGQPLAVQAAGGLLHYLAETQRARLEQMSNLHTYSTAQFMMLDAATRRNLELTESQRRGTVQGSLLGVLDVTVTSMGGRLLRRWLNQPLVDLERLNRRLDAVQGLAQDTPNRTRLRSLLKEVSDLERLSSRAVQGIARPRDLVGIRQTLEALPEIRATADQMAPGAAFFEELRALDPCQEVVDLLAQALVDDPPATLAGGGVIRPGFSAELDNVAAAAGDAKTWVANLEKRERERIGIRNLKVGYNKVFGYYLEVTKANTDRVPESYVRKQTLVNAERYITPELKEYESLILNAEERIQELESGIFRQVLEQVAAAAARLTAVARTLARLDVYAALAEVALLHRYVRPTLSPGDELQIVAGRHPVVEVSQREEPFVPNDTEFAEGLILVITGPNMSGKSTFLRQVALIVLMAQIGSFVPADEARIGLVDRIFTRIGAQDEISAGQSTFMVEMVETANLLNHATARSLLVLDEVGRGTSTYDGISIAWAVVEHIHNHPRLRCKTLFATHYHELTQLADLLPRVRNYNVAIAEEKDRIVFLRRVIPGGADRSYGIHVAQLAGLPKPVLRRAEEILEELEQEARAPGTARRTLEVRQLPLFSASNPALEELQRLDVSAMTPLEAISKLYELQKKAGGG
jgi:DNA mismatch repair protein MutS